MKQYQLIYKSPSGADNTDYFTDETALIARIKKLRKDAIITVDGIKAGSVYFDHDRNRWAYAYDPEPAHPGQIFPDYPNDPFYQQFDDPLRAYNNLPSLYNFYLIYPDDRYNEPSQLDHILYARRLAGLKPIPSQLPTKKDLAKKYQP